MNNTLFDAINKEFREFKVFKEFREREKSLTSLISLNSLLSLLTHFFLFSKHRVFEKKKKEKPSKTENYVPIHLGALSWARLTLRMPAVWA